MIKNIYWDSGAANGGAGGAGNAGGGGTGAGTAGGGADGGAASKSVLGSGAAGSGTTDWRSSLPKELQAEPSLSSFKDIGALAQSYVHAQRLVGADKIPAPQKNWTPEQWSEHYERLGRPKTADAYSFPKDYQLPEGMKVDDVQLKTARETFHKIGLSSQQAEAVLALYGDTLKAGTSAAEGMRATAMRETREAMEKEWKTETQLKLGLAQAALKKYGGEELVAYLDETGLGNNFALIKAFAAIGERISEDGVGGAGLVLPTALSAQAELARLNTDAEFQKALNDKNHPGHKNAVDKRISLFKLATASSRSA